MNKTEKEIEGEGEKREKERKEKGCFVEREDIFDMGRLKNISVFIGGISDERRIFESVRMSLGISLRGNRVKLILSPEVKENIENPNFSRKDEIKEFLKAIEELGGEVKVMTFQEALLSGEISNDTLDFTITVL